MIKSKKRRNRAALVEKVVKSYNCNICQKIYYSYPALYTHKRNKHNIIPITGKQKIFDKRIAVKYSAIENDSCRMGDILPGIILTYKNVLEKFLSNPNCILYRNSFDYTQHRGYKILKEILEKGECTNIEIPKSEEHPSIDKIFIIYLVYFSKVTRDSRMVELITQFIILFREHINIVGPEYKKSFQKFGIKLDFNPSSPYTSFNDCFDVPNYINDFISVFINMKGLNFEYKVNEILDISQNFCNWLFVNKFTNFKIATNKNELND
jgi:hypothetical protein